MKKIKNERKKSHGLETSHANVSDNESDDEDDNISLMDIKRENCY